MPYLVNMLSPIRISAGKSQPTGVVGKHESVSRMMSDGPDHAQPATAWKWIALLMLAAFVPRLLMAFLIPTLCVDGVGYVATAEAIERGEQGLIGPLYRLNTYPLILAGLHQLGFSWETAGKFWGVLCSVLLVPALFGWIRREFDDRVAVVACLLYAAHADLIEWSPETLRDPTFWLLFTWTLYFLDRAIVEVRVRHFLIVGLLLPAAELTRFEGSFLLIPLLGWTCLRYRYLKSGRARLLAGTACALLSAPLLLVVVNALWLKQVTWTDLVYSEPLKRLSSLTQTLSFAATGAEAPSADAVVRASPLSGEVVWQAFHVVQRGLNPLFALLVLAGLIVYRKRFFRADQVPLLLYTAAVWGGIWIHQWHCDGASSRYTLTLALLGMRPAAWAILRLSEAAAIRFTTFPARRWSPAFIAAFMLIGCCDALSTQYRSRELKAEIGRWIRRTYGENRCVAGDDPQLSIVSYYAAGRAQFVSTLVEEESLTQTLQAAHPDFVVLDPTVTSPATYRRYLHGNAELGVEPIQPELNVALDNRVLVLSREPLRR